MDFLGIGSLELILILVVLLIIVPPDKLPGIAGTVGRGVRKFKEMTAELSKDFKEMADEVKDVGKEGVDTASPGDGFTTILNDIKKEVRDVRRDVSIGLNPGGEVAKELKGLVGGVTGVGREISKVVKDVEYSGVDSQTINGEVQEVDRKVNSPLDIMSKKKTDAPIDKARAEEDTDS